MDWSFQDIPVKGHLRTFEQYKFSLDANKTGRGKTHIACKVAKELGLNVAVIAPANICEKWKRTLTEYSLPTQFVLSPNKLRNGKTGFLSKTVIKKGRGQKRTWTWHLIDKCFFIVDEVHEYANKGSQNSELFTALYRNPHSIILGLSATCSNDPVGLMVLGEMLGLHNGSDAWHWCLQHGCREGFFGGLEFTKNKGQQSEIMEEIHTRIFPKRAQRLRAGDFVDKRLPNWLFTELVDFDASNCDELVNEAIIQTNAKFDEDIAKCEEEQSALSQMTIDTRERQLKELEKLDWLIEKLIQHEKEGDSVVVFCNYDLTLTTLAKLCEKNKLKYGFYKGRDMTKQQKQINLDNFQADKFPIFLVNIMAGAASIDLHNVIPGGKPRRSYMMPTYSARLVLQGLGRIDREDKLSETFQTLVYSNVGIEKQVYENVTTKIDNIMLLNDGDVDPKVQFTKQ